MPNVAAINYATGNNPFKAVWRLTRALKAAGWKYLASSDGTATDSSANPSSDKWGGGTSTGNTGSAASISSGARNRATVTGVSGLVSPTVAADGLMTARGSVGNYLAITGATGSYGTCQIVQVVSSTSCIIDTSISGSDASNGAISWTEKNPETDTFPTLTAGGWLDLQGPSIIKVPCTAAASGSFIRGENVQQATTGAQGEVVGYTVNGSGVGYLVVAPRVYGTGAGRRGWDGTSVITGALSGATMTPSATPLEYVCEMVFWFASNTTGTVYYQRVDAVGESTSRFSALTPTTTVAPGGGGASNGFPTNGTFACFGTGGSASHAAWAGTASAPTVANAHIMCTNAIDYTNVSPDASFNIMFGNTGNTYTAWSFQRLDDGEEGDCDPYAFGGSFDTLRTSASRTAQTAWSNDSASMSLQRWIIGTTSTNQACTWRFNRRRGVGSSEGFGAGGSSVLCTVSQNSAGFWPIFNAVATPDTENVASAALTVRLREPLWVQDNTNANRTRKGSTRWIGIVSGGSASDTYDGNRWIQGSTSALSSNVGTGIPLIMAPADGATNPLPQ
jgi:hypothetical protein